MSPLTRRKPLQRQKPLRGTRTLGRKRIRRERNLPETPTKRHPAPKGPALRTVQVVLFRDGYMCVRCGAPLLGARGLDYSLHHRRGRDGKADSHNPENLASVCGRDNVTGCHGAIHRSRRLARPYGYALSRVAGEKPLEVPMFVAALGRFVFLTADGRYAELDGSAVEVQPCIAP